MNMYYRISNAFKIFWWALKNPRDLNEQNFKMASNHLELIFKVASERKPYMYDIGFVLPDGGKDEIVSVWAGAGIGAEPMKRIDELVMENALLKEQITEMVKNTKHK